jgi:outer membrane immunogenic protein
MKKLILGTVALSAIGVANVASAADMPLKAPPIIPVVYNWTGCYVGANGGYKWGRFRDSADNALETAQITGLPPVLIPGTHLDLDPVNTSSGAFGGQIGCRWENADHWVFGFEGDVDWTNLQGTATATAGNIVGAGAGTPFIAGDSFYNHARWESSARIVLGRSYDRWFFYGTGGLAFTKVDMAGIFPATIGLNGVPLPASFGADSKVLTGGTVGLGTLYKITRNWEIGAEYRYTYYQQANYNLGNIAGFCGFTTAILSTGGPICVNTPVTGHKGLETSEVLLKLNYSFDWGGPVVAKY